MPKAEISWKRVTEEGTKLHVYAQHIGRDWKFYQREKRFTDWKPVPEPPLEDWLELLDAVQRMVPRRRYQPSDEKDLKAKILEKFPEADI